MSTKRISAEYSLYSNLIECQFIGSPIHSSEYTPTNSAKELLFLLKTSHALQDIKIEDEDDEEEKHNFSESLEGDSFRSIN